jgi:flagellar protein FliS
MESVANARRYLAEHNIHQRVSAITRAQQIITELQTSLNFEQGGEISTRLAGLYDYIQRRLNDANFQQSDEPLAEVHGLLATVDEAWKQLADGMAPVSEPVPVAVPVPAPAPEPVLTSPWASVPQEPEPVAPPISNPWMTESPGYSYIRSAYTL